jgi:hypothetical protein
MGTGWSKLSVEEIDVYSEQEPGGKQTLGTIDSLAHFLFLWKINFLCILSVLIYYTLILKNLRVKNKMGTSDTFRRCRLLQ